MPIAELFTNHTYLTALAGTVLLGIAAALVGTFVYLRHQGLLGDVVAHAAFPGSMAAFVIGALLLANGRNTTLFAVCAALSGILGAVFANFISKHTPLGTETAMAITVSLFFGVGMLIYARIQNSSLSGKGGITGYLFGNAAQLTRSDILLSTLTLGITCVVLALSYRALTVSIFDPAFAHSRGGNLRRQEALLFTLLTLITVSGMRTVGLLLIIAFVLLPPAAARQWCKTLPQTLTMAALFGGASAAVGTLLSIWVWPAPTGAVVVLLLFTLLICSLLFAPTRGVITARIAARLGRTRAAAPAATMAGGGAV